MDTETLRAVQQPLKDAYREDPQQAMITLRAEGELGEEDVEPLGCDRAGPGQGGPYPASGGDGSLACSGDMLLQALVARAGVTRAPWPRRSSSR